MTIAYRDGHDIDLDQLAHLFVAAGWPHRAADRGKLALLVSRSFYVSAAYDGDRLVAFARALSDGVSNAYISTVCVLPDYRGRGLGREVVRRLVEREGGHRDSLGPPRETGASPLLRAQWLRRGNRDALARPRVGAAFVTVHSAFVTVRRSGVTVRAAPVTMSGRLGRRLRGTSHPARCYRHRVRPMRW